MSAVEAGRQLAGIRGLGCINCHQFAGHDSLGVPAVDLADLVDIAVRTWAWKSTSLALSPER